MKVFERRGDAPARRSVDVHARRMDALWRISTGAGGGAHATVESILAEAAAVMRPAHPFTAVLARAEGGELIVEAATAAVTELPYAAVLDAQQTTAWNEAIATPFRVGRAQYALVFVATGSLARPFDHDDEVFVEIVAAYLERSLSERWQQERLHFQLEHDALTGLINRSRFRALVNGVLNAGQRCGIAVVDVLALGSVNERLGYMTGDALLVEIGATLAQHNRDGEFIGRLYGASFAIAFPDIASRDELEQRLASYASAFADPFGTGDRENVERVRLDAMIGCAFGPEDGRTADALIACAESAIEPPQATAS
jgi:diguanylate cyclase (GGDEF)-like protein